VLGIGVFIWFIYPGAFVELDLSTLARSTTQARMSIALAGIWHNIILALVATLLIQCGILNWPWTWIGWETISDAVAVASIAPWSPLHETLSIGSIITHIDDHILTGGIADWVAITRHRPVTSPVGYCWAPDAWSSRK
jgi:S2P endopeptidase